MTSCNGGSQKKMSDKTIEEQFEKSPWQDLPAVLYANINHREFVEQNLRSPEDWEAALKFLTETDLKNLPKGRYELTENGEYANVQEYVPDSSEHFEAHKKYIDIQYVISGKEYIESLDVSDISPVIPYNTAKDVRFYDSNDYVRNLADNSIIFIFFPNDAHKPGINAGSQDTVKKVVIKVPYR